MYINSGAIYVHSATGVLTVRGNKQLYLREQLRGLLVVLLVMPINVWSKYLYLYSLRSVC